MERRSRLGIALRATGVAFATLAWSNATVNHWNNEKPDNFLDFSLVNYQKFYEANDGWVVVKHYFLMLDFAVLLVVPVVIIALTVRYLVTGRLRKKPPTPGCCEHCEAKAEVITTDQA